MQQVGRKAGCFKPQGFGVFLDGRIEVALGEAVAAVPKNVCGTGFANELAHNVVARSRAQNQASPEAVETVRKVFEAAVQPPIGCATERANARCDFIANVDDHDVSASGGCSLDGGTQRRIIGNAKVIAQPDDARSHVRETTVLLAWRVKRLWPADEAIGRPSHSPRESNTCVDRSMRSVRDSIYNE